MYFIVFLLFFKNNDKKNETKQKTRSLFSGDTKKTDNQSDGQLTYKVSPVCQIWCRITNELHLLILLIILVNKQRRNAGVYLRSAKYNNQQLNIWFIKKLGMEGKMIA